MGFLRKFTTSSSSAFSSSQPATSRKVIFFFSSLPRAGAGLAELADARRAAAAPGLVHHIVPEGKEAEDDEQIGYHAQPPRGDKAVVELVILDYAGLVLLVYERAEVVPEQADVVELVAYVRLAPPPRRAGG